MALSYSIADLLEVWRSAVDDFYSQPFILNGDGGGLEVYSQAAAQLSRVSQAIDTSMQALYLQAHSSQTDLPASGEAKATVAITVNRAGECSTPFLLTGHKVEEVQTDWGVNGGVDYESGRGYVLQDGVLMPGDATVQCNAVAEAGGWGYNNPMPGSLTLLRCPVEGSHNADATTTGTDPYELLTATRDADVPVPDHIGWAIRLVHSTFLTWNFVRQVVGYVPPGSGDGGGLQLDTLMRVEVTPVLGTLVVGEVVRSDDLWTGTWKIIDKRTNTLLLRRMVQGRPLSTGAGVTLFGQGSGATATVTSIDRSGLLQGMWMTNVVGDFIPGEIVTDAGGHTALWCHRTTFCGYVQPQTGEMHIGAITGFTSGATALITVVGYDSAVPHATGWSWTTLGPTGLQLTTTNAVSPTGGRIGYLDELAWERGFVRKSGESDASLRKRCAQIADTICPNSIERACARALVPLGLRWKIREVGTDDLQGFFYDGPGSDPTTAWLVPAHAYAYDLDFAVRPEDRFNLLLSSEDFRAFFLIGIEQDPLNNFGFAYDDHPANAYDMEIFYDGFAYSLNSSLLSLWQDVKARVAAGVGFDFYRETIW
jgi:hypothetical protein